MAKFDIDLVGKVGSLALIDKAYGDINYSTIARISRELRPGIIWVTSGATEIGRLDFIKRTGRELTGSDEDNKTDYSAQGQSVLMGVVSSVRRQPFQLAPDSCGAPTLQRRRKKRIS